MVQSSTILVYSCSYTIVLFMHTHVHVHICNFVTYMYVHNHMKFSNSGPVSEDSQTPWTVGPPLYNKGPLNPTKPLP